VIGKQVKTGKTDRENTEAGRSRDFGSGAGEEDQGTESHSDECFSFASIRKERLSVIKRKKRKVRKFIGNEKGVQMPAREKRRVKKNRSKKSIQKTKKKKKKKTKKNKHRRDAIDCLLSERGGKHRKARTKQKGRNP